MTLFRPVRESRALSLPVNSIYSETAERMHLLSPFDTAIPAFANTREIANPNNKQVPATGYS
jgi:hypothetical protein